jgi:CPA2 family monovalent cation:H+ antiporter-2
LSGGAISNEVYSLTLNAAIITMALTPALSGLAPRLYAWLWPKQLRETHQAINLPVAGLSDHVIVAGSGRVGRGVVEALSRLSLPFVLVEFDYRRVEQARDAGLAVIYGDASQPVVLEAAGIRHARALIVTVPAFPEVRAIAIAARQLRPDLSIIARADGPEAVRTLYDLGIEEVTSPEFEAAIEMTRQALLYFNVPAHDVLRVAGEIRRQRYSGPGEQQSTGREVMSNVADIARHLDFVWFGVPPDSPLSGRSLSELRVRGTMGVSIVGIIRDRELDANPSGDAELHPGDLVAVLGTREQITRFGQTLRQRASN